MLLPLRRTFFATAIVSLVPLLAACPKKEAPSVDAGPPPAPAEEPPTTTILEPLDEEEDAGEPEPDAAVKKAAGKPANPNVARLKQCCNALANEAKRMGSSPEAGMFMAAATQCNGMAAQAGATGNAPELGALGGLLSGRTLPAICSGF